ncbi:MAG: FAD binding domain-containing protein [Candidatus Wallbacteria bacterium]|nr:FAD binding domain-containing protein [Candidatus Wallbacteria bacterium]
MRKVVDYFVPENPKEALQLLKRHEKARILAGGSGINAEKNGEYSLIDLKECGLSYIKAGKSGVRIGAMTTISEILGHPFSSKLGTFFVHSLATTGHAVVRNQITIGGSVASMLPWFNLATLLLLLEAELKLLGPGGEEKISFAEYTRKKIHEYLKNRLIVEVILPSKALGDWSFTRLALTEVDFAPLFVCSRLSWKGKNVDSVKIAVSGCTTRPMLLPKTAAAFSAGFNEKAADDAGKTAVKELNGKIISANLNFPLEYIVQILPAFIKSNLGGLKC